MDCHPRFLLQALCSTGGEGVSGDEELLCCHTDVSSVQGPAWGGS